MEFHLHLKVVNSFKSASIAFWTELSKFIRSKFFHVYTGVSLTYISDFRNPK